MINPVDGLSDYIRNYSNPTTCVEVKGDPKWPASCTTTEPSGFERGERESIIVWESCKIHDFENHFQTDGVEKSCMKLY